MNGRVAANKKFYEEALVSTRPDGQRGQLGDHVSTRVSGPGATQCWTSLLSLTRPGRNVLHFPTHR